MTAADPRDGLPKFGAWMRGIHASESNPERDGMFVRVIRRSGRMNPGTYYELTDGKGNFWRYPKQSVQPLAHARPEAVDAVAWVVFDAKHIRFTIFNKDLAEALSETGLLVLPMIGAYEWFNAKAEAWQPINRLPYTWERELGIAWRVRATLTPERAP